MRFIYNWPIKKFIIVILLLFTIIPCCLNTFFISWTAKNHTEKQILTNKIQTYFSEFENDTRALLYYIQDLILNISSDETLYQTLDSVNLSDVSKTRFFESYCKSIMNNFIEITAIQIISADKTDYFYAKNTIDAISIEELESNPYSHQLTLGMFPSFRDKDYVFFYQKIYNYNKSIDLGYIVLYFNNHIFDYIQNIANEEKTQFILISGMNSRIIYHPDPNYNYSKISIPEKTKDNNQIFTAHTVKFDILGTPLILYCVNDQQPNSIQKVYIYLSSVLLTILLIAIIISMILNKRFFTYLQNLNTNIRNFITTDTSSAIYKTTADISMLATNFNHMILKIDNLTNQIKKEKERQHDLETQLLQSQINPHFIYNVLDTISWEVKKYDMDNIDDMICSLACYLRLSLHGGQNIVTIRSECEHIKQFIALENYRYNNAFEVNFYINNEIMDKKIPKITFQPIVENSIRHGFNGISYKGCINIFAQTAENDILIRIVDNGVGIPNFKKDQLPKSSKSQGGFGLYNVNERLKLYFGDNYQLKIESSSAGTIVTLRIPSEL